MSNNKNSSNTNTNNNNNDELEAIHMLNCRLQSQSRHINILQNFSHHPINYQLYYQLLIGDIPPSSMAPFIYQLYYQLLIANLPNKPPVFPEGIDGSHFIMNNHFHGGFSFGPHDSHHVDDAIMTYLRMSQNHMTMFGEDCPICACFPSPPHPAQNYGPAIPPPPPPINNNIAVDGRIVSLEHTANEEFETNGTTRSFINLLYDPIEEVAAEELDLTLKL